MWRKQKKCVNSIATSSIVLKAQNMMRSKPTPYMTDEYLEILCQNIKLYDIPESCIVPVKTNGTLNTLDIRHYSWNIGERLGWSGQKRATFIKLCFPTELQDVEVESMRRTLRQKGKCVIEIDVPDYNDYQFHHQK